MDEIKMLTEYEKEIAHTNEPKNVHEQASDRVRQWAKRQQRNETYTQVIRAKIWADCIMSTCVCWMLAIFNDMEWFLDRIQQYLAITFFILSRSFCRFWGFASIWVGLRVCESIFFLLLSRISARFLFRCILSESNWICSCFVEICDFRMTTSHARSKPKTFLFNAFSLAWCFQPLGTLTPSTSLAIQCENPIFYNVHARIRSLALSASLSLNRCVERL